ncbi:MAG: hypothetical protein JWM86_2646 [Thermoleophilia bacterium]|nr:hypothetical protein [Thermoleophilia bacterium]
MTSRADRSAVRSRRRKRRVLRGITRMLFWGLVLAGVFVLGIGYGKTLSGEDELRSDKVTIDYDPAPVEATLPTRTETVTKTVTVAPKRKKAAPAAAAGA